MKGKKLERLDGGAMLDAVPVRNRAVRVEEDGGGNLVVYVPIRRRWFMKGILGWLLPFRSERGYALDRLGREVWQACDGRRRVEEIVEEFARRHHLRFHEARAAVMQFLRQLTERGLIVMVVGSGIGKEV